MDRKAGSLTLRELTAIILLVGLLLAGLLTGWYLGRQHRSIAAELEDCAWLALSGQWENAGKKAEGAKESWEQNWKIRAAFSDHTPMEEVDELFGDLTACIAAGERTEFARVCMALSARVTAMEQAHQLTWWNVL